MLSAVYSFNTIKALFPTRFNAICHAAFLLIFSPICPVKVLPSMRFKVFARSVLLFGLCAPLLAHAEIGIYAKGGTLGVGGGIGYGISNTFSARVGYTALNIDRDFHTTDVDYKGTLKLGGAEAMLDWYPFAGSFRITGGVVFNRNNVDVTARLNHSPIYINGTPYDVNDIASISGKVKFRSTVPYLGVGWGNVASSDGNFHFVADIGVAFQGSPKVTLDGSCSSQFQSDPNCAMFMSDVAQEEKDLNDKVSNYKWWPVLNLGLAYRF